MCERHQLKLIRTESSQALEIILGKPIPDEKSEEGLLAPKVTLAKILNRENVNYQTLVSSLSPKATSILVAGPQAQELKASIETMLTPAVKV